MSVIEVNRSNLFSEATRRISHTNTALDIGAGINPREFVRTNHHICVEPFKEYFDILNKNISTLKNKQYSTYNFGWREATEQLKAESVYLFDVIEHLEKEEGKELLKLTDKCYTKQLIIFTPLGLTEQHTTPDGKDAWGLNGATWQKHRSGWYPEDFDNSWVVLVCKAFHMTDNLNRPLKVPYGAIFAIKTK